ncbi:hypothetical protein HDV02_006425 [Globomyces sp. JEL0801]|nr:hypothetical protein HDV02_006425 [Globomyces sp. JEL0801]
MHDLLAWLKDPLQSIRHQVYDAAIAADNLIDNLIRYCNCTFDTRISLFIPPIPPIPVRQICYSDHPDKSIPEQALSNVDISNEDDKLKLVNSDIDIECRCCYLENPISKMASCTKGHLFCLTCCKRAIETLIVHQKIHMKCMDTTDCNGHFDIKTIQACLPEKGYERYQTLVEEIELKQANLEGLERCPFCPYAVIIENGENDPLFCCERQGCLKISCKLCKKADHTPLPCPELLEHSVAEAMSNALMRECPKCSIRYYKTKGCNKMTCVCGQKMCYVCRKAITDYSHFNDNTCPLNDDTAARNRQDVSEAKTTQLSMLENQASVKQEIPKPVPDMLKKKSQFFKRCMQKIFKNTLKK